ncbi:hypothetical protein ACLE20_13065 [Rhizobium sp. YIM 134829]|uniref:hypothetical protein n=1 Tax=Rhizobium sp. YIM 134829 TaxID=3390453 RepID=UPI003979FB23
MSHQEPCASDKQAALEAVLASDVFARSERLRAFLTYVVEKELAGEAQQLKGYTIAIDVFGRSQNFNADSDPLVRVHAGKLRKLLTHYYETEGVDDPWQIEIPKGGYTPIFRRKAAITTALPEAQTIDDRTSALPPPSPGAMAASEASHRLLEQPLHSPAATSSKPANGQMGENPLAHHGPTFSPATKQRPKPSPFAALSILPLLMLLPLSSTAMSVHVPTSAMLRSNVAETVAGDLPHLRFRLDGAVSERAQQFSSLLGAAFAQYRTINSAKLPTIEDSALPSGNEKLSFEVSITDQQQPSGLQITITSTANDDVVLSSFVPDEEMADENDLLYETLQLASNSLTANGAIFRYAARKGIESNLMRCMRLTDVFRLSPDRQSFRQMRDCQQGLIPGPDGKIIFAVSAGALPKAVSEVK